MYMPYLHKELTIKEDRLSVHGKLNGDTSTCGLQGSVILDAYGMKAVVTQITDAAKVCIHIFQICKSFKSSLDEMSRIERKKLPNL